MNPTQDIIGKLPKSVGGLSPSASAFFAAELSGALNGPDGNFTPPQTTLVVCPNTAVAEGMLQDLEFFLAPQRERGAPIELGSYLSWEVLPFDLLSPASSVSAARIFTLRRLALGLPAIVVASVESLMQRVVLPEYFATASIPLAAGEAIDRDELLARLTTNGYVRSSVVEECGQLAVRGSVIDCFPPGGTGPVRIEFFGDTIESIRRFDPGNQRSSGACSAIEILPIREFFWNCSSDGGSAPVAEAVRALKSRASELSIAQRYIEPIEEALLSGAHWPGLEHLQPIVCRELCCLWEYLPENARVVAIDQPGIQSAADAFSELVQERAEQALADGRLFPDPHAAYQSGAHFERELAQRVTHVCNPMYLVSRAVLEGGEALPEDDRDPEVIVSANDRLLSDLAAQRHRGAAENGKPFAPLADWLRKSWKDGYAVAITVSQVQRRARMAELLTEYGVRSQDAEDSFLDWLEQTVPGRRQVVTLLHGQLRSGITDPNRKLKLVSDSDLFPDISTRHVTKAVTQVRRFLGSISQLSEGDYVVHMEYGIGRYLGLRQLTVEGKAGEFLELEYAEQSKLYIPVDNLGKVQKYSSADKRAPALTKLGGQVWEKTKSKVRERVAELAGQLLNTLAERELSDGFSFGPPDSDDARFADSFPFEETPDQSQAIRDVLQDMELSKPMDRLVCGDVGYGKTEVALRAAFKSANAGKQVVLLVPTTILAEQHFATFTERFTGTAIRVGCVSRFYGAEQNRKTLQEAGAGAIDIIIGTHRLLQRDVHLKDLGLVIVDEEHRFGVAHKEKLKRMRAQVDFLALSATPIPRSLHMSLVGIKDLSLIETPPVNRQVIRTYLANYDQSIVREAILRELGRSGQVFYIHNRVQNIAAIAEEVREIVPEARVAFAHGQMKERQLETIMHRFVQREIDVLVSTTIVESGLDIPNANTIIIRKAENFGLAELYQLRGRVGRSSRRAYSYLLITDPHNLGDEARRRLQVLQSLDDLGVGFRLALQDMEIRGAGNILGGDQSGHVNLVGYELYTRILREAVETLRRRRLSGSEAQAPKLQVDPDLQVGFPAYIPNFYIPDVSERLLLYQRLVELENEHEVSEIADEITDRFGGYPPEVGVLLELMQFRALLKRWSVTTARLRDQRLFLAFHPQAPLDGKRMAALARKSGGVIRLSSSGALSLYIEEEVSSPRVLTDIVSEALSQLS